MPHAHPGPIMVELGEAVDPQAQADNTYAMKSRGTFVQYMYSPVVCPDGGQRSYRSGCCLGL
jgi:hypothetical protein